MDVELRHLWTFVVVAEEANFTRAANRLNFTQQAVSSQIRKLERALGVPLFDRTTHYVALTAAGAELLEQLVPVLNTLDRALASVRSRGELEGTIRLVCTPGTSRNIVPDLVEGFQADAPGVAVVATLLWGEEIAEALDSGAADIGVSLEPNRSARFHCVELDRGELGIAIAEGHPLAANEMVELASLAPFPVVFPGRSASPGLYDRFAEACQIAGFRPRVQMKARVFGGTSPVVLDGDGVEPWPSCQDVKYVTQGLVHRPIVNPVVPLSVYLLAPREHTSALVDRFVNYAANFGEKGHTQRW